MTATLTRAPAATKGFRGYPEYKDSGIDWLGEIPTHWQVKRLRSTITACQNGVWGDEPDGVRDVVCVRVADFDRVAFRVHIAEPTLRSIEPRILTGRRLQRGDLLLEKSGGGEQQPVGVVVTYDHDVPAVCSNFIARVAITAGYDARYLTYLHASMYSRRLNTRHIKQSTGIQNLDSSSYFAESTALPDLAEQRAIATFLDRETSRIDALAAKEQHLIQLLEEERAALITRAVTKGLDPNVAMKDSGVEWLGEIPASWVVAPIGFRYDVQLGKMLDSSKITGLHLRPYLRVFDVQWGAINTTDLPEMDFDAESRVKFRLEVGDLLVNEGGSYPGRSALWQGGINECYYQKALHRLRALRPREDSSQFLYFLMYWAANQGVFVAGGNETTIEHLPAEKLRRYRFAFPPHDEQRAIVARLERETARIDALIARVGDAIACLHELRTALVTAAVTGKIDVRGYAP